MTKPMSQAFSAVPFAALATAFAMLAPAGAQTLSYPTAAPVPATTGAALSIDPVEARAREWLTRMQKQPPDIDRAQLSAAFSNALDTVTAGAIHDEIGAFGDPSTFERGRTFTMADGSTAHVYRLGWSAGSLDYLFALDKNGKITALYFRPA